MNEVITKYNHVKIVANIVGREPLWFFSATEDDGPAHVITDDGRALCGAEYNLDADFQLHYICEHCKDRIIAIVDANNEYLRVHHGMWKDG